MVRIEFLGAWKDEDVQAVRDVTVTGIEKNLKISVLPAYFEEEYSSIEENCLAFSENCMRNGKIASVECGEAEQRMSGVKFHTAHSLFCLTTLHRCNFSVPHTIFGESQAIFFY